MIEIIYKKRDKLNELKDIIEKAIDLPAIFTKDVTVRSIHALYTSAGDTTDKVESVNFKNRHNSSVRISNPREDNLFYINMASHAVELTRTEMLELAQVLTKFAEQN